MRWTESVGDIVILLTPSQNMERREKRQKKILSAWTWIWNRQFAVEHQRTKNNPIIRPFRNIFQSAVQSPNFFGVHNFLFVFFFNIKIKWKSSISSFCWLWSANRSPDQLPLEFATQVRINLFFIFLCAHKYFVATYGLTGHARDPLCGLCTKNRMTKRDSIELTTAQKAKTFLWP